MSTFRINPSVLSAHKFWCLLPLQNCTGMRRMATVPPQSVTASANQATGQQLGKASVSSVALGPTLPVATWRIADRATLEQQVPQAQHPKIPAGLLPNPVPSASLLLMMLSPTKSAAAMRALEEATPLMRPVPSAQLAPTPPTRVQTGACHVLLATPVWRVPLRRATASCPTHAPQALVSHGFETLSDPTVGEVVAVVLGSLQSKARTCVT